MSSQDFWDDLWGDQKVVPIKPLTFNSNKLAKYFEESLFNADWHSGFGMVNLRAMAGALAKWKHKGIDADTVTAMIDAYMNVPTLRGKNPGWSDFMYQSEQIAGYLTSTGDKAQPVKDKWDLLEEQYEGNA